MKKMLVVLFAVAIATSMSMAQDADKKMDDKKMEKKEMKHKKMKHEKMKHEKMEKKADTPK